MVATLSQAAGLDPTWLLGADLADRGPGGRSGLGDLAVVEADEAYGSFLWLAPDIALVTNVEEDHLDHYGTMESPDRCLRAVRCLGNRRRDPVRRRRTCPGARQRAVQAGRLFTYGLGNSPDVGAAVVETGAAGSSFALTIGGRGLPRCSCALAGRHNVQNALGPPPPAWRSGWMPEVVAAGLAGSPGPTGGSSTGARYGAPTSSTTTPTTRPRSPPRWRRPAGGRGRRVIAVFQPHLYSRTQAMWRAFGTALAQADVVVVTDVYGARSSRSRDHGEADRRRGGRGTAGPPGCLLPPP